MISERWMNPKCFNIAKDLHWRLRIILTLTLFNFSDQDRAVLERWSLEVAFSPRTSRRFTGELSWWAQGQRRFFPYWSKTLGLAGYWKVQLMWGQVHLLWCLAYSYWVDFGSSIYIKNETRLLWLRCFCFRTLRTFQTFGYEVSSANRQDLLLDRR